MANETTYVWDKRGLKVHVIECVPVNSPEPRMPLELFKPVGNRPASATKSSGDVSIQELIQDTRQ